MSMEMSRMVGRCITRPLKNRVLLCLLLALFPLAYFSAVQTWSYPYSCTLIPRLFGGQMSNLIAEGDTLVINMAKGLFFERISHDERAQFRSLMRVFDDKVAPKITYFLYAGALLGSYSHHGMIPWDDDMDIIVRYTDRGVLLNALKSLAPEFGYNTEDESSWKLYYANSTNAGTKPWSWPFLDIFFYYEYPTYIQDARESYKKFIRSDVFPLTTRPFMGMMLPAPRKTREFLRVTYDIDLCTSNSYDHKREKYIPCYHISKIPCHHLRDRFRFVRRVYEGNKTIEILEDHYHITVNKSVHVHG
ncbi:uncharacterized protein [Haliotis cracherodii]|uniref:uncharacterized protein n=1 Tax=Haliotis cracherodii TaxID=6455 RepID=UPI0039EA3179